MESGYLRALRLSTRAPTGRDFRVLLVENGGSGAPMPEGVAEHPRLEVIPSANWGFAAANNVGLSRCTAERVLILNPDTEIVGGTLSALCRLLDERPQVGVLAVRQLGPDGELQPTLRRFPSFPRALAQALWCERWPVLGARAGERVLNPHSYSHEIECDWSTGAVLLARRTALSAVGGFDERFFLYSEETDLCLRVKKAGWRIVHVPHVAFVHHAGKAGVDPKREAQMTYARLQYAEKHFRAAQRIAYRAALVLDRLLRAALLTSRRGAATSSRAAAVRQIRVLAGREGSPYAAAVAETARSS